ncbi:FAD-dependent oxidoreductase [Arcicella aquatica]|uniref:Glycerol-3-phosphate dehydrogenase n=1 Tax=Arcicella aquatica TaxID=217141 RepID=A0ABU5QTF9_9BACT|nr:FAD-dependent oxidoreductase [Arcicella aquatica]MEA5259939.1 FAD-dependent oxidoreductase [Arcicella aquatica]
MNRIEQLSKISSIEQFDLCIIGGGATGAGIALDATLRGLKVLLIDKADFAGQTTSKSTKLIHGGVRYLEQAVKKLDWEQYKMVQKSLHERDTLIKNAPHLTRPLALLTPCYSWIEGIYLTIGLKLYEWIAGNHGIGASKWLSRKEALKTIPELKKENLTSAVLYYDGQLDDARYCLAIIQKAEALGATVLNYAEALRFEKDNEGKLTALTIKDNVSNNTLTVQAKVFINATGPFADHIRKMANTKLKPRMKVSRGAHIVLPTSLMKNETAILVPKTDDGRVLFIIPWQDHLLVGTTDEEDKLSENPDLEPDEIPYLLSYVNRYLEKDVTPEEITSGFAGQRPLLGKAEKSSDTKSLVRDHEVEIDKSSQLVSIMGGKWTTYRLMAKDTIDHVYETIWHKEPVLCTSEHQLLHGAEGYHFEDWQQLVSQYHVSPTIAQHLMKKYGSLAATVLSLAKNQSELKELIHPNHPFIQAEIVYAIQEEMAVTTQDVLNRRLGLGLRDAQAAKESESLVEAFLSPGKTFISHQNIEN